MKRLLPLLISLSLFLMSSFCIFADNESQLPRLTDKADLLSSSEESSILTTLDSLSEYHGVNICIRTVNDTLGKSVSKYADDFYNKHYEGDGVMLLLDKDDRDWYITTSGNGIEAFTDYGIDEVGSIIVPYLSDGDYAGGFNEFATQADRLYSLYEQGQPLDVPKNEESDPEFDYFTAIAISLALGLIFAFIIAGTQKATLKSVRRKLAATEYAKDESFRLIDSRDVFEYRTIDRVAKPKPEDNDIGGSSIHMSDGGFINGGGGGKF